VSREYAIDIACRAAVIPLGIAPRPVAARPASSGRRVLFVGRIERRKGVHVLLDAIAIVAPEFPDAEFLLIGNDRIPWRDGRPLADAFRAEQAGEPWSGRVRFLGEVDAEERDRQYAACDVFVAPSLYESFGLVYLEAMRHGKPVIGCRVEAFPRSSSTVRAGCSSNRATPSLCRALRELLADSARRAAMGARAAEVVRQRFGADLMAERTLGFYRALRAPAEVAVVVAESGPNGSGTAGAFLQ
jgi:glycosyltransferase involved in cell wall biosynthesis